jgi:hypothetical protein
MHVRDVSQEEMLYTRRFFLITQERSSMERLSAPDTTSHFTRIPGSLPRPDAIGTSLGLVFGPLGHKQHSTIWLLSFGKHTLNNPDKRTSDRCCGRYLN